MNVRIRARRSDEQVRFSFERHLMSIHMIVTALARRRGGNEGFRNLRKAVFGSGFPAESRDSQPPND